jgi:anaerobic C4-dicarboxylate transporter DcuA
LACSLTSTDYTAASGGQESVEQLDMAPAIMIMVFAAAGMNMLPFRASAAEIIKTSIMSAGMVALISIAGLGWLGSSFFELRRQQAIDRWKHFCGDPTAFVGFRPRVVRFVYPAGRPPTLIAMFPAVNGYFFLPTYATMLAISFDPTDTTRIGKYVLNHSFILPGMVATISSVSIGFLLAKVVF